MGGWSDKTKSILNPTQFKFMLKLELSLAKITGEIVATAALPVDHLMATNAAACAYFLTMGVTYHEKCITLSYQKLQILEDSIKRNNVK